MAIPAADVTLFDLGFEGVPGVAEVRHLHHLSSLLDPGAVVELENSKITDTAVDTRVRPQVVRYERDVGGATFTIAKNHLADVRVAIGGVVGPRTGTIAVAAYLLTTIRRRSFDVELLNWKSLFARPAALHTRKLAGACDTPL
jgi:hypothetical protein